MRPSKVVTVVSPAQPGGATNVLASQSHSRAGDWGSERTPRHAAVLATRPSGGHSGTTAGNHQLQPGPLPSLVALSPFQRWYRIIAARHQSFEQGESKL